MRNQSRVKIDSRTKTGIFELGHVRFETVVCGVLLLLSIGVLSLFGLDADPPPMKQLDDIWDEAAWAEGARSKVLFGSYLMPPNNFSFGLIGSPLFTFLLRVIFGVSGVHFTPARVVTVLCFWLVLVVIFILFRCNKHSVGQSLVPVAILGLNHEALIHARWSTPIFLEILFHVLAFALLILSCKNTTQSSIKRVTLFGSGLAFATSISAKLTGIYMIFVFWGTVVLLIAPLKRIKIRDIYPILSGSALGLACLTLFAMANVKATLAFVMILVLPNLLKELHNHTPFAVFSNPGLANPMVCILIVGTVIFAIFQLCQWIELRFFTKKPSQGRSLDVIEVISLLWLFLGCVSMILFRDNYYRRYVLFIVPLTLVFVKLIFFLIYSNDNGNYYSFKNIKSVKAITATLVSVGTSLATAFYLPRAQQYFNIMWISAGGASPLVVFNYSRVYLLIGLVIFLLVFFKAYRTFAAVLIFCVLATNISLNVDWLTHLTFSFRDESRRLNTLLSRTTLWSGNPPYSLFYEAEKVLPVLYIKSLPQEFYKNLDIKFRDEILRSRQELLIPEIVPKIAPEAVEAANDKINRRLYLQPEDFPASSTRVSLGDFFLFPVRNRSQYRLTVHVTRLIPPQ